MKWEELSDQQKIDEIKAGRAQRLGVRDIGALLGISGARISQFTQRYPDIFPTQRNYRGRGNKRSSTSNKQEARTTDVAGAMDSMLSLPAEKAWGIVLQDYMSALQENIQLREQIAKLRATSNNEQAELDSVKKQLKILTGARKQVLDNMGASRDNGLLVLQSAAKALVLSDGYANPLSVCLDTPYNPLISCLYRSPK